MWYLIVSIPGLCTLLPILLVINWRRFNGNVLANSETFRFGDILTWGRFDVHAEPEVRRCGEFDFIISEVNKKH